MRAIDDRGARHHTTAGSTGVRLRSKLFLCEKHFSGQREKNPALKRQRAVSGAPTAQASTHVALPATHAARRAAAPGHVHFLACSRAPAGMGKDDWVPILRVHGQLKLP